MSVSKPFALLKPISGERPDIDMSRLLTIDKDPLEILRLLSKSDKTKVMSIDFETRGTATWKDTTAIVGVGVCLLLNDDTYDYMYVDTHPDRVDQADRAWLFLSLNQAIDYCSGHVIAYNVLFDMSVLWMELVNIQGPATPLPKFTHDAYVLYKSLSSEGWPGQSWSLKAAMTDVLGWADTNEEGIDNWLLSRGYYRQGPTFDAALGPGESLTKIKEWLAVNPEKRRCSPKKEEMHRVPPEILGPYCILDTIAALDLYTDVIRPVLDKFPRLEEFHTQYMIPVLQETARQQHQGIRVDKDKLLHLRDTIQEELSNYERDMRSHPDVGAAICQFEQAFIDEHMAIQPEKFLKKKDTKEPIKHTKKGVLTTSWINWDRKQKMDPALSKSWIKWEKQLVEIKDGLVPKKRFNPASNDHLVHILYTSGLVTVEEGREPDPVRGRPGTFFLHGKNGKVELDLTDAGNLSADTEALGQLPEELVGPIIAFKESHKELSYVESYLELLHYNRTTDTWRLHAGWVAHGTTTGRFAGKEPSLHQMPKSLRFLSCMINDKDSAWLEQDWCLPSESTDVLTKDSGWVKLSNLTENSQIWVINPDTLQGHWECPSRIIDKNYEGPIHIFGNKRGALHVTENHRCLWITQDRTNFPGRRRRPDVTIIQEAQKGIPANATSLLAGSSSTAEKARYYSEREIWMACMIQADGSASGSNWKIEVSLPKKRQKVTELLGRSGKTKEPHGTQRLTTEQWYAIQFTSDLLDSQSKTLKLETLDTVHADTLFNALAFWDGHTDAAGRTNYSSTKIENANQVQAYFVRCGYEARISTYHRNSPKHNTLYRVHISKGNRIRLRRGIDHKVSLFVGRVGCVTVSTGVFLVRQRGQTFVTGNCSLEPHVLAELSRDKALLDLYGPKAKPHDRYLYTIASLPHPIADKVKGLYNLSNPTKDSVSQAKKECKKERELGKILVLSGDYGAGAVKKWKACQLRGINISLDDMKKIHELQLNLHKGVFVDYQNTLRAEWRSRGGWVLSGLGFPTPVSEKYEKDLINRVIQRTGHDCHTLYLGIFFAALKERGIPYVGIVIDFHDQFIIQVPSVFAEDAKEVAIESTSKLNELLGGIVRLSGDPRIVMGGMAEAKMEEDYAKANP